MADGVARLESNVAEDRPDPEVPATRPREPADVIAAAVAHVDLDQLARCHDRLLLLSVLARVIGGPDVAAGAELAASREALRPVADALAAAPAAQWWWEPVDRNHQRWVGTEGSAPPRGDAVAAAVQRNAAEEKEEEEEEEEEKSRTVQSRFRPLRRGGERSVSWWSPPLGGTVFTTTGPIDILPAVELGCGRENAGEELFEAWAVHIDQTARIREIGSAAGWQQLAAEFPRDVTATRRYDRQTGQRGRPWILPDWTVAAREWDGIHLSIGGYLNATGVALPGGNGRTLLAGWEPDWTLWLNDAFATVERVGPWRGTPGSAALPEVTPPWLEYR